MNGILHLEGDFLQIKGATKVASSTISQAVIETGESEIIVLGQNIEVKKLNLDDKEVCLSGNFSQLKFNSHTAKVPLIKRIFK